MDINFFNIHMAISWQYAIELTFRLLGNLFTIFLNVVFLRWAAVKFADWMQSKLSHWRKHNPIEDAIERHYRHKALNRDNHSADPLTCEDTSCRIVRIP